MKNLLTLALLAGTAPAAYAQITDASIVKPGTVAITGGVGYARQSNKAVASSNTSETSLSQFYITPGIGFFFANNTLAGVSLSYSINSNPNSATTTTTGPVRPALAADKVLRLGGFIGHTKMFTDNFGFFGNLNGGYQHASGQEYYYQALGNPAVSDLSASGYYVALTPGISYWPVRSFSVSATMGSIDFSHLNYDYPTNRGTAPSGYENVDNDFGARFGLNQFVLTATYFIGRPPANN